MLCLQLENGSNLIGFACSISPSYGYKKFTFLGFNLAVFLFYNCKFLFPYRSEIIIVSLGGVWGGLGKRFRFCFGKGKQNIKIIEIIEIIKSINND
jgi:hypothetical protein